MQMVENIIMQGRELTQFVNEFTWFLRNILVVKLSSAEGDRLDMTKENLERIREISGHMEESTIVRYINVFPDTAASIKYSSQKRIVLEMAVIKLCIESVSCKQLVVITLLYNISVLHHKNDIRISYC